MTSDDMQTYLADALDQEACKNTLIMALESRVKHLQDEGVATQNIIERLEELCDDAYQINDDVILYVMESLIIASQ